MSSPRRVRGDKVAVFEALAEQRIVDEPKNERRSTNRRGTTTATGTSPFQRAYTRYAGHTRRALAGPERVYIMLIARVHAGPDRLFLSLSRVSGCLRFPFCRSPAPSHPFILPLLRLAPTAGRLVVTVNPTHFTPLSFASTHIRHVASRTFTSRHTTDHRHTLSLWLLQW